MGINITETVQRNERGRRREAGQVSDRRAFPRLIVSLRYRRTIALITPLPYRQGRTGRAGIRGVGDPYCTPLIRCVAWYGGCSVSPPLDLIYCLGKAAILLN